ncbi:pyridoxamine 5'-phosphate oxidase family protein [Streptomyces sp. NPDC007063]|uniref:pyridoxamine 5'-phosphate oxidase family protein n=1 Tax=Streptomyces sp. NPDC007063 TaxID=3364772 RepID=UPI0036C8BC78
MAALSDANGYGDGSAGHAEGTGAGTDQHPDPPRQLPGSDGEHALQQRIGSQERAERFYQDQVLDHLNERMREFTQQQEMFFLATADRNGECDNSFRAGPPGFLRVLDERTLVFPEYRGNGVHASLGNIGENPHVGLLLVDFLRARIGLHINGRAQVLDDAELRPSVPDLPQDPVPGRRAVLWVRVEVEEAYIHCAKHIPHLQKAPRRAAREWGTDDYKRKGGDFFGAARDAREGHREVTAPAATASPGPVPPPVPAAPPVPPSAPVSASPPSAPPPASGLPAPAPAVPAVPPVPPSGDSVPLPPQAPPAPASLPSGAIPAPRTPLTPGAPPAPAPVPAQARTGAREPAAQPEAGPGRDGKAEDDPPPGAGPTAAPEDEAARAAALPQLPQRRQHAAGTTPAASSAVSAAISARAESAGSAEHARDVSAWRLEAERALAEAQRRGRQEAEPSEPRTPAPFQGWFG